MKILFLAEPDSANTRAWAAGLCALGCEVRIGSVRVNAPSADGKVIPLGPRSLPARLRLLLAGGDLRRAIAEFKPDLLLAYRVTSYGYLAAGSGFHPLVVAAMNEQIIYQPRRIWVRTKLLTYFAKFAIAHANLLHAWSPNIADGLRRFGARNEQILILHRGIDTELFSPAITPRIGDPAAPILISTRALHAEYRVDDLLRVLAELRQRLPGARLVIAGEGPERPALAALAKKLGIDDAVEFIGVLSPDKVVERLRQADFYVSLIRTEGVSSSLLEACACGIYPVVTDMPASRHFPGNDGGLLLPELTPAEIAVHMADLLADSRRRQDAVQRNLATVRETFSREHNLRRFVEAYQGLTAKSQ
jgi:glycosyltransferase involved in cell wall biosynthesis